MQERLISPDLGAKMKLDMLAKSFPRLDKARKRTAHFREHCVRLFPRAWKPVLFCPYPAPHRASQPVRLVRVSAAESDQRRVRVVRLRVREGGDLPLRNVPRHVRRVSVNHQLQSVLSRLTCLVLPSCSAPEVEASGGDSKRAHVSYPHCWFLHSCLSISR